MPLLYRKGDQELAQEQVEFPITGKITTVNVKPGDAVQEGDILCEVETDKAIMELQARGEGVLRAVLAPEGSTVEVGSVIGVIAAKDDDISDVLYRKKAEP